jgi:hypothetical protein
VLCLPACLPLAAVGIRGLLVLQWPAPAPGLPPCSHPAASCLAMPPSCLFLCRFAVAWYPLYCVPEAPLTARFLTFHTLASLWDVTTQAEKQRHTHHQQQQQEQQQEQADLTVAATNAADSEPERQHESALLDEALASSAAVGSMVPATQQAARPSYKSMLAAGLPQPQAHPPTATPTAVCSFPGSPTFSDAGARASTSGGGSTSSRPLSVDGAASSLGRSRLACSSGPSSSAAGSAPSESMPASAAPSVAASSAAPSAAVSEAGDGAAAEPLALPVAGLAWYATGRDENWTETLVAAQLPAGAAGGWVGKWVMSGVGAFAGWCCYARYCHTFGFCPARPPCSPLALLCLAPCRLSGRARHAAG